MGKLNLVLMGRAMLSKSLIQLSADGWGCVPSLLFDPRPNYDGGNENNRDLLQNVPCRPKSVPPTLQQAPTNPHLCQRLRDTHKQVWVSLLWVHFSVLLGSGAHKVLFVPSKSLFSQSCASSVIKSHWPPKSDSLVVLSPFFSSPGWEICCGSWNFLNSVTISLV